MSKKISSAAAAMKLSIRVVSLQDELADTQGAYEKARNRAAQSKLDLQATQRGISRMRAKLDKLEAYMESHQQTANYRAEQRLVQIEVARAWFVNHPDKIPDDWEELHGEVK